MEIITLIGHRTLAHWTLGINSIGPTSGGLKCTHTSFIWAVVDSGLTKWCPEVQPVGFFPDKALAIRHNPDTTLRPDGFVPNSILVRLLWPQTAIDTQRELKKYSPPEITEFYDSVSLALSDAIVCAKLQCGCVWTQSAVHIARSNSPSVRYIGFAILSHVRQF